MKTLAEVFEAFNEETLPILDKLARDFEFAAAHHIGEPEVHAFYQRFARVVHDFSQSLGTILKSATPQLRAQLTQSEEIGK
jgi:hypothetical protein